jgi:cytochrome c biogenesis protein CcmG/thiol:disulfide interchange protein DsbE
MRSGAIRSWLVFSLAILLAGAVWTWLSRAQPGATSSGNIPAPREGFLAPDFSLSDSKGKQIRLSDYRGRPVLVNVWASWCAPCKAEMPAMQRAYTDYQGRGFEILAVNSTSQDSFESASAFAQANGLSFPILYDSQADVARQYQIQSLPTSFFIDNDGMIRDVVIGGPMSEALLRVRIEQLFQTSQEP